MIVACKNKDVGEVEWGARFASKDSVVNGFP